MRFFFLIVTESMAENVLEQTRDKELHISSNQIACTVIEHLLPFADADSFERFQRVFADNFRPICANKFASHILETLVSISFLRGVAKIQPEPNKEATTTIQRPPPKFRRPDPIPNERQFNLTNDSFSDEHRLKCHEFVLKVSKFLLNNLEDYVWDTYGNHVMRKCLNSLSGIFATKGSFLIPNQEKFTPFNNDNEDKDLLQVPSDWIEVLQEYAARLQSWPQFPDFPYSELSSGLMQSLCSALGKHDKSCLKHLGKRMLNESFKGDATKTETTDMKPAVDEDVKPATLNGENGESADDATDPTLPHVFTTESSIRCLEVLITVAGPKLLTSIYLDLFQSRLVQLSTMKSANFAVQKLLAKVKTQDLFDPIFDELSPSIEDILQIGHTGVVHELAQACLRLSLKQGPFVQQLQTALDCSASKEKIDKFVLATLKLKPYSVLAEDKSNFVHLHGALILQAMLKFNKPIKIVQCMLNMKNTELAEIFCSQKGSHIVDAYIESGFIGEKSRERLIKYMDGCYLDMATSRFGSWAVEKLFNAAADQQKARIVKELAEKCMQLNGSPSGRLINSKLRVDTYRLSPEQWRTAFNKGTKAEKLFKNIL